MSDQDIRKLYEGIRRGESHDSPVREKDLYEQILQEATITIRYDDGQTEDINISDDRARELSDISTISTTRNQVLYKINGSWVGRRLGKKQLKELSDAMKKMSDYQTIEKKIIKIATSSTIFKPNVLTTSFDQTLRKLIDFLTDSATLTLMNNNNPADPTSVKQELNRIINLILENQFQKQLIDTLDGKSDDGHGISVFPIWDVLDPSITGMKIYFDVENHPEMLTLMPAGEDEKTRGAAGPGEALLSFIYGGIKPKGSGDILLSSDEEDTIELKKQEGRIGKAISKQSVSKIDELFYGKSPGVDERNKYFTQQYYGDDRQAEPMIYLKTLPPDSFYQAINRSKPVQEPGIQIFPVAVINDINAAALPLPSDMSDSDLISANGKRKNIINIPKSSTTNIPAETLAGTVRTDQNNALANMNVTKFLETFSGVSIGDKSVTINKQLPDITVVQAIEQIGSDTPRQGIVDLIGVWHLKHYLTHIEPFKWLLVYTVDGQAAAATYEKIISTPALELVTYLSSKNLRFGARKDEQGFHIEIA